MTLFRHGKNPSARRAGASATRSETLLAPSLDHRPEGSDDDVERIDPARVDTADAVLAAKSKRQLISGRWRTPVMASITYRYNAAAPNKVHHSFF
jgi:hypothetical protein